MTQAAMREMPASALFALDRIFEANNQSAFQEGSWQLHRQREKFGRALSQLQVGASHGANERWFVSEAGLMQHKEASHANRRGCVQVLAI
ncbi:hypothetical protein [Azohydromonas australica]|uniref:hypothetical protein n=1 Tax=Azohydromonas australica TaxID=364039 RepID=UPI0012ECB701|nr:hypothetical protein [Azohydromonas australica]